MDVTYRFAWKEGDTVLYMDVSDLLFKGKSELLQLKLDLFSTQEFI